MNSFQDCPAVQDILSKLKPSLPEDIICECWKCKTKMTTAEVDAIPEDEFDADFPVCAECRKEVPEFPADAEVPDVPPHGYQATDVDGVAWVFNAEEDEWRHACCECGKEAGEDRHSCRFDTCPNLTCEDCYHKWSNQGWNLCRPHRRENAGQRIFLGQGDWEDLRGYKDVPKTIVRRRIKVRVPKE